MAADRKEPPDARSHRGLLHAIAVRAMRARGLAPDFPDDVQAAVRALSGPARRTEEEVRDLRGLLWCSIDNDDSMDLDQLSVADQRADGSTRILVAIADVDALVGRGSPIDRHAAVNTTSVYTAGAIFPMLPEALSTDLTSLADHADRLAVVIEFTVAVDGSLAGADIYGAVVRNQAKLAYNAVGAWLEGRGPMPPAVAAAPGMADQLGLQDRAARTLGGVRHEQGALEFETIEVQPVFENGTLRALRPQASNRATALIEDLMIAANGVTARFLSAHGVPSIRRVVKTPDRWDRIVALAAESGEQLPAVPDPRALAGYLERERTKDPARFPDVSHTIIKLLGRGEYVVERAGVEGVGHFGLAVKDYTHSTAPNRRYPDLLTQRLVKAALAGKAQLYAIDELERLADHCTEQEDAANKVERQVRKSAAALLVSSRIGAQFSGIVTGASSKGTWARVAAPPIEGKVVRGEQGLDVGDRVQVRLVSVDVERGYIDFVNVGAPARHI